MIHFTLSTFDQFFFLNQEQLVGRVGRSTKSEEGRRLIEKKRRSPSTHPERKKKQKEHVHSKAVAGDLKYRRKAPRPGLLKLDPDPLRPASPIDSHWVARKSDPAGDGPHFFGSCWRRTVTRRLHYASIGLLWRPLDDSHLKESANVIWGY